MQICKVANKNNTNFGISTETVRRANQTLIERGRLARNEGLELAEYNALHREDFVHKIGNKTFDFYAFAKKITSDKEKVKKAFNDAWDKVIGKNI